MIRADLSAPFLVSTIFLVDTIFGGGSESIQGDTGMTLMGCTMKGRLSVSTMRSRPVGGADYTKREKRKPGPWFILSAACRASALAGLMKPLRGVCGTDYPPGVRLPHTLIFSRTVDS
jgi:hypothetical protein